jgi:hypothetical protein
MVVIYCASYHNKIHQPLKSVLVLFVKIINECDLLELRSLDVPSNRLQILKDKTFGFKILVYG